MTTPADRYRETLRKAAITPNVPLHAALLTAYETALTAQESVRGGARGLTPEGERELIRRVTEAAAESTEREVERIVHRFDLGLAVKVAITLACFALGGVIGHEIRGRIQPKYARRQARESDRHCMSEAGR